MVSVNTTKELVDYLKDINRDTQFCEEVIEALADDLEAKKLIEFLKNQSDLLQSDVYLEVMRVTNGRFVKDMKMHQIKKDAMNEKIPIEEFIEALTNNPLIMLSRWDLTEEEQSRFELGEIGDTIRIETELQPVLYTDGEDDSIIIPFYTSEYELREEYRRNYAQEEVSMQRIIAFEKALRKTLNKKVKLIMDMESTVWLEISDDFLEMIEKAVE